MITRNVIIILGLIIFVFIVGLVISKLGEEKQGKISLGEKELIEAWIIENVRNLI